MLINLADTILLTENGVELKLEKERKIFNKIDIDKCLSNLASFQANYQSKKKKTAADLLYLVFVQASLADVNLQLLRDVIRETGTLNKSIFAKLHIGNKIDIPINYKKDLVEISGANVIKECHLSFENCYTKNCPYSIDYLKKQNMRIPIIASFPIITGKSIDHKILPTLERSKISEMNQNRLLYQRKFPLLSAFIDFHLILLILSLTLFVVALYFNKEEFEKNSLVQVTLNIAIYGACLALFLKYFQYVFFRVQSKFKSFEEVAAIIFRP
jgi:hypothetical protein